MSSHSTQYPASLTGGVFAKPKRPMEFHVPGLQVIVVMLTLFQVTVRCLTCCLVLCWATWYSN